jgi:uncharacterized Zn finger protein
MDYFYGWKPYVSVGARRRQAERQLAALSKKGHTPAPVHIEGRKIATTFWGKAWCENLERYSDFASRLPRGRTYVRNGSVVDLQIARGTVTALVSGSDLYQVRVGITAVPKTRWQGICRDCTGAIDSIIELLQGRLSTHVMTRICEPASGLFPEPRDVSFECSCPDWASMCKHVAAVLYGVGARLDARPELLFQLRDANQEDLIAKADTGLRSSATHASGKVLESGDLSQIFGIEMAGVDGDVDGTGGAPPRAKAPRTKPTAPVGLGADATSVTTPRRKARARRKAARDVSEKPVARAAEKPAARRTLSAKERAAIAKRMKRYWAERLKKKPR